MELDIKPFDEVEFINNSGVLEPMGTPTTRGFIKADRMHPIWSNGIEFIRRG